MYHITSVNSFKCNEGVKGRAAKKSSSILWIIKWVDVHKYNTTPLNCQTIYVYTVWTSPSTTSLETTVVLSKAIYSLSVTRFLTVTDV